jgi:hypothetical protein
MGGRYLAGTAQLLLALAGAGLGIAWFIARMTQVFQQINGDATPNSVAWLGEAGAVLFVAAWVWSLFTSLSLEREARGNEPPCLPPM